MDEHILEPHEVQAIVNLSMSPLEYAIYIIGWSTMIGIFNYFEDN